MIAAAALLGVIAAALIVAGIVEAGPAPRDRSRAFSSPQQAGGANMAYDTQFRWEIRTRCDRGQQRVARPRWTDERTQRAVALWKEGLSASQIAQDLGNVTRNGVIGKLHRLGISCGRKPTASVSARTIRERRASRLRAADAPRGTPYREAAPLLEPQGAHLIEHAEEGTCRHIAGDPRVSYRLCGRDVVAGGSYCSGHRALVYQPSSRAKRTTDGRVQAETMQRLREQWLAYV